MALSRGEKLSGVACQSEIGVSGAAWPAASYGVGAAAGEMAASIIGMAMAAYQRNIAESSSGGVAA
jgi:hypothetical protein